MPYDFTGSIHGIALGNLVQKLNQKPNLVEEITKYCRIHKINMIPHNQDDEGEYEAFYFPDQNYYLCRFGPDGMEPCWVPDEIAEKLTNIMDQITKE
jgi:hypothetical protein